MTQQPTVEDRLVEPEAPGDLIALENSLTEATRRSTVPAVEELDPALQQNQNQQADPNAAQRPEWLPEKFWTGDLATSSQKLAESNAKLHTAYGRMANDLGTQRQITDRMLALDKRTQDLGDPDNTPAVIQVDSAALVDDPTTTLDTYWKTKEASLRAEIAQEYRVTEMATAEAAFLAKYPNYGDLINNEAFVGWVGSSKLRQRAAALAREGDYTVADELLTEFDEFSGQPVVPVVRDEAGNVVVVTNASTPEEREAARQASLENAANAGNADPGTASTTIYRRADLIRLKLLKPEVYADPAFQVEIVAAYRSGRVR